MGGEDVLIARAAGFSVRLRRPPQRQPEIQPPGLGQLLLVLRGEVSVREAADPASKVLETRRPERRSRLTVGRLFEVANDARWSLTGSVDAVVLAIATSVPRAASRVLDLGRRGRVTSPGVVFHNDALRLEVLVQRGRFARSRRARAAEYVLALRGGLDLEVDGGRARLLPGALLPVPADSELRLEPTRWRGATALVVCPALDLRRAVRLDREAARGFTPFDRG